MTIEVPKYEVANLQLNCGVGTSFLLNSGLVLGIGK